MYPKEITNLIVELWGLVFTAEETVKAIQERKGKHLGIATVYRKRNSLTAQNLIDELLRRQERAILKADTENPELGMKYRNELLKILLPQRIEAISRQIIEHIDIEEKRNVTILAEYVRALDSAIETDIHALRARQQVDTAQANPQTS
jgi:Fe2+ or Zn2+ uptake regulation protein